MSGRASAALRWLGRRAGAPLLRGWAATLRKEARGWDGVADARRGGPVIVVFWHSRFLMLPFVYPRDRPVGILISPSSDGTVIADTVTALGRAVIRGSSRRGGKAALDVMEQRIGEGWDVAIAVDGPLGPAYELKMGPLSLAQKTGRPVVPVVYASRRGWALPTWDRFWLPAPWSRTRFVWCAPRWIGVGADLEHERRRVQDEMRAVLAELESWAGRTAPWLAA